MDELDDLLRAAFRAREDDAPDVAGLATAARAGHVRRVARRRLTAVGTAGVLAVGASSALALTLGRHGAATPVVGPAPLTATGSHSGAGPTAGQDTSTARPLPGAESSAWSSRGLEVRVPKAWKANQLRCGTPTADTVEIDQGGTELCLIPAKPFDVVEFGDAVFVDLSASVAMRPTTVGGHPATTGTEHLADGREATALVIPDLDVSVTVMSRDPGLVASIVASARIVGQDANGCPVRVASVQPDGPPARPGAGSLMVPGKPVKAVVCHYAPVHTAANRADHTGPDGPPVLGRGVAVPAGGLTKLTGILDGLKPGLETNPSTGCLTPDRDGYVFHFTYASGAPVDVYLHTYACDHDGFSNGTVTGILSSKFLDALPQIMGEEGFSGLTFQ